MSAFAKTRAAAEYAALHGPTDPVRARAEVLLMRLASCAAALDGSAAVHDGNGEGTLIPAGELRGLVLTTRDLVGRAWLQANLDDTDAAEFAAMCEETLLPEPDDIDRACSAVLWARFSPRDDGAVGEARFTPSRADRLRRAEPFAFRLDDALAQFRAEPGPLRLR